MSKAGHGLLVVIASLLIVNLVLDRILPSVVLHANRERYGELVGACEKARASVKEARERSFEDEMVRKRFLESTDVELLACLDRELWRNRLLGWGVTEPAIRAMELEVVTHESDLAARAVTRPYAE